MQESDVGAENIRNPMHKLTVKGHVFANLGDPIIFIIVTATYVIHLNTNSIRTYSRSSHYVCRKPIDSIIKWSLIRTHIRTYICDNLSQTYSMSTHQTKYE